MTIHGLQNPSWPPKQKLSLFSLNFTLLFIRCFGQYKPRELARVGISSKPTNTPELLGPMPTCLPHRITRKSSTLILTIAWIDKSVSNIYLLASRIIHTIFRCLDVECRGNYHLLLSNLQQPWKRNTQADAHPNPRRGTIITPPPRRDITKEEGARPIIIERRSCRKRSPRSSSTSGPNMRAKFAIRTIAWRGRRWRPTDCWTRSAIFVCKYARWRAIAPS